MRSREEGSNLNSGNYRVTSDATEDYNCTAWAAGIMHQWWEPVDPPDPTGRIYWPEGAPPNDKIPSVIAAFACVGFVDCKDDGSLEQGFEKIALYTDVDDYLHAARQLENGKWTSKLGELEDIEHDAPEDLAGPAYGNVSIYMKRKRA
jgi:hypothetical protein